MERTRKHCWYGIIKYIADFTKGEPLNIGLILKNNTDNQVVFKVLEENNTKLNSIFENKLQKDTYKYGMEYFNYYVNKSIDADSGILSEDDTFTKIMSSNTLPKGFYISEPQFAKTFNVEHLFTKLLETYIGKRFLNKEQLNINRIVKDKTVRIMESSNLLSTKIKQNLSITPIPFVPIKYNVDFVYRKENKLDLIQAAPSSENSLADWFEKINVLSKNFIYAGNVNLIYDSSIEGSDNEKIIRALHVFKEYDENIKIFDISSSNQNIRELVQNIETNATNSETIQELIA